MSSSNPFPDCLSPEDMGTTLSASRVDHVRICARCEALISSWESWQADPPAEARTPDGQAALAEALDRELATAARSGVGPTPWWRRGFGNSLLPVGAIVGLSLIMATSVIWRQVGRARNNPVTLRGEAAAEFALTDATWSNDGQLTVSWEPHERAQSYRVLFVRGDLEEVHRVEVTQSELQIDPAQVAAWPATSVLCTVVALVGGDEIARTPVRALPAQ